MKKLSIEQKAQRYDKALEIINDYYQKIKYSSLSNALTDREVLKKAFPELAESDDERIRKELLDFCKNKAENFPNDPKYKNISAWIAWLEKQGQTFTKKDVDNAYLKGISDTKNELEKQGVQKLTESGQETKPNGAIVIEDFNEGNGFYKVNLAYLNKEQVEEIEELVKRWNLQPKGDEDESIISDLLDYFDEKPQQKVWGENEIKMLDNLITYLDGRKDLLEEIKRTYIDWLESLKNRVQPKQEWSEEDETKIKSIIALLKSPALCAMDGNKGIIDESIKYLKSIKDRVQPQHKEWSEEDEKIIKRIDSLLYSQCKIHGSEYEEIHNWFKSLRPQSQWKPSDEQMDVLLSEVTAWTKGCPKQIVLESLYNDLKKLKG